MPQLVFLTLFLGLTTGKATVSLQADPAIASIRIELGGRDAATIAHAPWSAEIDFGPELTPQRLIAIGYDEHGKEVARASQDVNLPRASAEVEILVKNEHGHPARVELVGRNRKHSEPTQAQLSLDGDLIPIGDDHTAKLPAVDRTHPHVLSAVMTFRDGEVAHGETIVSGGLGQSVSSDLTPVMVTNDRRSDPQSLEGCFALDGVPVRANAIERTNALVILIKDPDSALPPAMRNNTSVWWVSPLEREYELDADTSTRILWASPEQYAARGEPTYSLFSPTIDFSSTRFGVAWLITRSLMPKVASNIPRRFADAVGVAGLAAYQSGQRRAVVLLLENTADLSVNSPALIRRYLERLGVPLFVWSIGKTNARGWGDVVDIKTRYNLITAVDAVKSALRKQRIAWVAADPLASLRIEGNDRCGLKPAAAR